MTLQEFIQLAEQAKLQPRQRANGEWRMHCPAHHDDNPSLDIREGERGLLLQCRAGCSVEAICSALGINVSDLFFEKQSSSTRGCRIDDLSLNCQDLELALAELGCQETHYNNIPAVAFPYQTPEREIFYHFRVAPEGKSKWLLQHGAPAKRLIFNLRKALERAKDMNFLIITESPLDAATLWACGFAAIATVGKANAAALSEFRGFIPEDLTVFAWLEPQAEDFAQNIANALQRQVWVFKSPNLNAKDAWRLLKENNGDITQTRQQIEQSLASATQILPTSQLSQSRLTVSNTCSLCNLSDEELLKIAHPVLASGNPLEEAARIVSETFGVVGEIENLQLLFLSLTTRVFPQPVSVLVTGGTGQGKSFLTDAACSILPPCRYRRLVGASARALLFHPLTAGTVLHWLELPEISGDSVAATILRNILWQSSTQTEADYLFVEWTSRGAQRRRVVMPRQIALVTTKVALPRDEQLLSRFLVIEVKESAQKRASVFEAIASHWALQSTISTSDSNLTPLQAFQEWLNRRTVKVIIPFANVLAHLMSELPPAERDFRDFSTLLKLVAAHALWFWRHRFHLCQNDVLEVHADLDDYQHVFQLLLPVWGKPRSEVLSSAERATAEALRSLHEQGKERPSTKEIATTLNLPERTVRWRLKALADKGVVEEDTLSGRAKCWRLIADLDAFTTSVLPLPENVRSAWLSAITATNGNSPLADKNSMFTGVSEPSAITATELGTIPRRGNDINLPKDSELSKFAPNNVEKTIADIADSPKTPVNIEFLSASAHLPILADIADSPQKATENSTNLPETDKVDTARWLCVHCWLEVKRPIDADLFGVPRCPRCGQPMRELPPDKPPSGDTPQPSAADANEQTNGGEKFVDTLEFLEQNFGPLQEIQSDPFAEKEVPQEVIDQWLADSSDLTLDQWLQHQLSQIDQPPEPDQPPRKTKLPPSSCRELANDLLRILRQFQRSNPKHQRCLTDPCPICREKVRQIRYLERANSRNGLLALWQRAQAWQQAQGGGAA